MFGDERSVAFIKVPNGGKEDVQGNIIALLDANGKVVVEYVYDAWGNHAVLDSNGNDLTDTSHIGNRNPFRYRGYFYDVETGLYYLQTRYYDPEIGRFLNMDDVSYADPEQFHGLNLYAYCGNDPVNNIDPTGHFIISLIASIVIGAAVSAIASAVTQYVTTGTVDWAQLGISALFGAVGGALSFIGIGGTVGQFFIQGSLSLGETMSLAAAGGSLSDMTVGEGVVSFIAGGLLGMIGANKAAKEFKRVSQIEGDLGKVLKRGFKNDGFSGLITTWKNKSAKYIKDFIKPTIKGDLIISAFNTMANICIYFFGLLI